jgi:hypothetical protein|nr:MAG TPA: hypothetical protein [Caudoviricetes sp.]
MKISKKSTKRINIVSLRFSSDNHSGPSIECETNSETVSYPWYKLITSDLNELCSVPQSDFEQATFIWSILSQLKLTYSKLTMTYLVEEKEYYIRLYGEGNKTRQDIIVRLDELNRLCINCKERIPVLDTLIGHTPSSYDDYLYQYCIEQSDLDSIKDFIDIISKLFHKRGESK